MISLKKTIITDKHKLTPIINNNKQTNTYNKNTYVQVIGAPVIITTINSGINENIKLIPIDIHLDKGKIKMGNFTLLSR